MTRRLITCIACGGLKPHSGRRLCSACHKRLQRAGGQLPPRTRPLLGLCSVDGCGEPGHANGLCPTHHMRKWRYGDPLHASDKVRWREAGNALIDRCKTSEALEQGECWPWTGAMRPNGYGNKRRHGTSLAHRVVWIEVFGPIGSSEMDVCHRCDNPPCVRPSHLFLGTAGDNVADMMGKGREYRKYGNDHHHIKLTDAQVAEIRELRDQGHLLRVIAERYGLASTSYVSGICRRKRRIKPGGHSGEVAA